MRWFTWKSSANFGWHNISKLLGCVQWLGLRMLDSLGGQLMRRYLSILFAVTCHRSVFGVSNRYLFRSQDILSVIFEGLELTSSLWFLEVWEL